MKIDPANLLATAKATGFDADNLEKLLRLRELLTEFHKHPFLRGKLALNSSVTEIGSKLFSASLPPKPWSAPNFSAGLPSRIVAGPTYLSA
jgi:hypothetical protein